jgi:D-arabinose 1-dehydrogenase-like Zn-dependent alcohol dehydrogenase
LGCRFATAFTVDASAGDAAVAGLVVEITGGGAHVPMDVVVARELEIYGSHGMAASDYPPMMTMVADVTLRPGLLVGRVIGWRRPARRWPRWTARRRGPG